MTRAAGVRRNLPALRRAAKLGRVKAAYIQQYGGPERIQLGDLPAPRATGAEVVIDVRAASINPLDWKVLGGMTRFIPGAGFPRVLGADVAGVVSALGRRQRGSRWAIA